MEEAKKIQKIEMLTRVDRWPASKNEARKVSLKLQKSRSELASIRNRAVIFIKSSKIRLANDQIFISAPAQIQKY